MFNLLPDSIKKEIRSEYKMRRISVILIFVLIIQIFSFISLFPSWVSSRTREESMLIQLEKIRESNLSSDANEIKNKIKSINSEINVLNSSLEYRGFSPLVDFILSKKTPSITLNSFTFTEGKTSTITLKGISSTRESLVAFVDSIKSGEVFSAVELPVSNLAKNRNISFSITLNI